MSSFWWGQSALDELIEKATSELLPAGQVDLALHLEISDQIRSKKVNAKDAIKSLKQRLGHKNPNVILATLSLVDTCMKNSGSSFVKEVATREFMEEVTHLIKVPTGCNQDVKQKVLYLIQVWGVASKGNPSLSYISGTYSLLRAEGYTFPPITERIDSILLETAIAPEWTDSDCCERCRTTFTLTNRKHHCRQCGATFCQQCSSKNIPLPHLGINDIVRVCDGCYIKVKLSKVADKDAVPNLLGTTASISSSLTPTYTPSIKNRTAAETITTTTTTTNGSDDQFEDDIKKAIEISLKESEKTVYYKKKEPVIVKKTVEEEEEEENLAAAIAASLQDLELSCKSFEYNSNELSSIDMENIQLFSTLMQHIRSVGGDVSGDNQINKLYTQIGTLQPKLVKTLDETSQKHDTFVALHGKLNNAVKAYDRLLEERLSRSAQCPYYPYPQQHSYPQNYNQQTPVVNPTVAPVNPTPSSTNTLYQPPYRQHPYVAAPVTLVQQQSYIATPVTPVQQQPYSAALAMSAQQQSYIASPVQQQLYAAVSAMPTQQQSYIATPAQQQAFITTPAQQQSYVPESTTPAQTYSAAPVQQYSTAPQRYTSATPVQQQAEYQQYQYPSVPTTAPRSDYYGNQSYYNPSQLQQKEPIEEAPLIEL